MDLEQPIRQKIGNDLFTSIVGEYDCFNLSTQDIDILIGKSIYPITKISGFLKNNKLLILKGSLSRSFYSEDYELIIDYVDGFNELSNMLPPFVLVDYLHECHINYFDTDTFNKLKDNWFYISKLNYSKFYVNKNINVLLLPNTISDFTMLSSVISDSLLKIFLLIEEYIYGKTIQYNMSEPVLTSIGRALAKLSIPSNIITEIKYLRNFVAHGYLLNESLVYDNTSKQFSVDFLLDSLYKFTKYLKDNNSEIFGYVKTVLTNLFVNKVIYAKYKKAIETSMQILKTYPNYNEKELFIKNNFLNHSFIKIEKFNDLNKLLENNCRIVEVSVKGLKYSLYFKNNKDSILILNNFMSKNGLSIVNEINNGIHKKYFLESK